MDAEFTYSIVFFEKLVFFITVLATSATHCPGSNPMSSMTARNKVDLPVEDGPMR